MRAALQGANNYEAAGAVCRCQNLLGGALSLATLGTSLRVAAGFGSLFGGGGQSTMNYGGQSWPCLREAIIDGDCTLPTPRLRCTAVARLLVARQSWAGL